MKKLYCALLLLLLAGLLTVGVISLTDQDPTISKSENRKLEPMPEFSWSALLDGSYIQGVEKHYVDTFPLREQLLGWNRLMNQFYYFSPDDNNYLAIDFKGGAEQGGVGLHEVENALRGDQDPKPTDPAPETPADGEKEDVNQPTDQTPEDQPTEDDTPIPDVAADPNAPVTSVGTIIILGDNAMDIPTANFDVIESYGQAVNNLAAAMGDGVRTFSLVTPNSGEFYSPESFHTAQHSQKDMIDYCYEQINDKVLPVDAYSVLQKHADEYVFFRTDHHWTARGAYYAYTAFCKTAGFDPVPLEQFETGQYDRFLGSMYTYTKDYPQSSALVDHPDTLEYFLPVVETHAKYYSDTSLSDGVPISVVYTKLDEAVDNKYLCFIGGDTPICIIETAVDGPTCMVLKESYGNALVPFLTSHYGKIVVIDPRKFNRQDLPKLDLKAFAKEQGVDDLLVVNYPFMINNSYYVDWLNRLVQS